MRIVATTAIRIAIMWGSRGSRLAKAVQMCMRMGMGMGMGIGMELELMALALHEA